MTKISGKAQLSATLPATLPDLDLQYRPGSSRTTRRRIRSPARVKRVGAPIGKRSRPETPLLKWKIEERDGVDNGVKEVEEDEKKSVLESCQRGRRRGSKGREVVVSARKLAAGLWKLQLQEAVVSGGRNGLRKREDHLGFQPGIGHFGVPILRHDSNKAFNPEANDFLRSPRSFSDSRNGLVCKFEPSFQYSNSAMEGATKWEPACLKTPVEARHIYNQMRLIDQQAGAVSALSALEAELEQAHLQIEELETERRASKKKLEYFLKKVSEEKALWRSREHEKIRAFIEDIKAELNREKKTRQRVEIINSKLVNELADHKLSVKRIMQDYEKERKERSLVEEVCDELAKEIGEDKAEIEALKRESMKLREEVEEERKMLQMAEVWREERVQMKLVDAKVALEEKYSQMHKLVADLENFLRLKSATPDVPEMKEAMLLKEAAAAMNIQDVKEFTYEPSNPDDIFSVFEEVHFGESNEREIGPCVAYSPASRASKVHTVSPEANVTDRIGIQRHSNSFIDHNDDIEEDESGWETVSHLEDQGSSNSPEESIASVNKNRRESNASVSGTEWEGNGGGDSPVTEISEVCSVPSKQLKKISSIARLWKSCSNNEGYKIISLEGINGRLSNGRLSNVSILSADGGSVRSGISPPELAGQWSSPDSANAHTIRGKKGCIPRNTLKGSLKAKLLEARMESHKVQLRQVLKQKI